jgi:hypothetical protein
LGRQTRFTNDQQQELSVAIRQLRAGNMSPNKFQEKLAVHNIPQTNHIQTLIRRAYAGDSKVTYYEFGREIFKNY